MYVGSKLHRSQLTVVNSKQFFYTFLAGVELMFSLASHKQILNACRGITLEGWRNLSRKVQKLINPDSPCIEYSFQPNFQSADYDSFQEDLGRAR